MFALHLLFPLLPLPLLNCIAPCLTLLDVTILKTEACVSPTLGPCAMKSPAVAAAAVVIDGADVRLFCPAGTVVPD